MMNNTSLALGVVSIGVAVVVGTYLLTKLFNNKNKKQKKPKVALVESNVKYPFKLHSKESLTHDTRLFRFLLPSEEHVLGLPLGQHIYLSAHINGELVVRPYTPTTVADQRGYFDLVLKVYKANVNPRFPNGGKMSQYLDQMVPGDSIDVRGPSGKLAYKRQGVFEITVDRKSPPAVKKAKKVGMIAGGTGITPMYQLIQDICNNPDDNTQLWLIFANQTEDDILLRDELERFQDSHPNKLKIWYTIDRALNPDTWNYSVGFVNEELLKAHLPSPSDDTLIVMCGPPPMINFACNPNLDKLEYSKEMRFAF